MSLLCSNSVIEIIMRERKRGGGKERERVCANMQREKVTKTVVERSALYFLVLPLTAELNGTAQGSAV